MEFWIFAGLVVAFAVLAWAFKTAKSNDAWHELYAGELKEKFGSLDLAEIHERELQPAVLALQASDYYAVTTHFTKLADDLSALALRSAVTDFDIRYAKQLVAQARETFLKKHNLFEPSTSIGKFFGPTHPVQFGTTYVPAKSIQFGSDWISSGTEIFPLVAVTDVEVYADGQKIVNYTSRASLTSGMLGAVLPGSSLLWATVRPKVTRHEEDDRQACILVTGSNFDLELEIDPEEKKDARFFAKQLQKQVELIKGSKSESQADEPRKTSRELDSPELTTKISLAKLAEMYSQGLISEEEFSLLKENL